MKFIEGRSLAELLRVGTPLPVDKCLRIVEQVASAIDYAHRRGVVHGDVRPANVLLDAHDWAFVTDFVIGRVLDRGPDGAGGAAYVAPEDTGARHPTPAADQYALAVTVYECLAGAAPTGTAARQRRAAPRLSPPRLADVRPDLPGHLSDAVERAMDPNPGERFASVLDFVSALSAAGVGPASVPPPQRGQPSRAGQPVLLVNDLPRGNRWLGIAATVVLVGVGGVALAHKPAPETGPPPLVAFPPPQAPSPIPPPAQRQPEPVAPALAPPPAPEPARPASPAPEPVARRRAPVARTDDRPSPAPGRLYVSSRPWGRIYVDGEYMGNTPKAAVPIQAGVRYLRIQRDGYASYEQRLVVAPGEEVRLVDIVLEDVYQ
jgi:serine/threonine-protein kinase